MVVESSDAHDDHGVGHHRAGARTKAISEAIEWSRRPHSIYARLFSMDARDLLQKWHLGIPCDGRTDAVPASGVLCRFTGIHDDALFRWRNAEQPRLG